MKTIITLIFTLLLAGCNPQEEEATETPNEIFDPQVPGGVLSGDGFLPPALSLTADASTIDEVRLAWTVPSSYIGQSYTANVYRIEGDASVFVLPDPSTPVNTAFVYKIADSLSVTNFTDTTAQRDQEYTYYVYFKLDDRWSSAATTTLTTESLVDAVTIPDAANFWSNWNLDYGYAPNGGMALINTITPSFATPGAPSGVTAFSEDGSIMYYADHACNRVVIYMNQQVQECSRSFDTSSVEYDICVSSFSDLPMSAFAVIGQQDGNSCYPCGDPLNTLDNASCLTDPRAVAVDNGKLFILDSGNARIKGMPLPTYGCHNILAATGTPTPVECAPTTVIGKRNLADLTTYPLATHGDSAFGYPVSMAFKDGDAYIGDSDYHRITKVRQIHDPSVFYCDDSTWGTALCRFNSLLGQADMFSSEYFEQRYDDLSITYDVATNTLSDGGDFLIKHCKNPTQIRFENTKMYVACNEEFTRVLGADQASLNGRILVYDEDIIAGAVSSCRVDTWPGVGCDAEYVFGQESFDALVKQNVGDQYNSVPYAFETLSFDVIGTDMLGVSPETNYVYRWSNVNTDAGNGNPYDFVVLDPENATDAVNSRTLPDLENLSYIEIVPRKRACLISDPQLSKIFEVGIIQKVDP